MLLLLGYIYLLASLGVKQLGCTNGLVWMLWEQALCAHTMAGCSGGLSGGASLQEPMGSEGVPEDLSVEELERHIRALQLEIARSDDAGVGGRLRRGSSAEYTKGDDLPMHANTPLQLTDAMSAADEDLHLRASYSMRWTLASERKQHKPT